MPCLLSGVIDNCALFANIPAVTAGDAQIGVDLASYMLVFSVNDYRTGGAMLCTKLAVDTFLIKAVSHFYLLYP